MHVSSAQVAMPLPRTFVESEQLRSTANPRGMVLHLHGRFIPILREETRTVQAHKICHKKGGVIQ